MFGFSFTTIAVAAGVALASAVGIYWLGDSNGFQRGREAALERSVDILRERAKTDDETRSLDDVALCRSLGGLPDECAKLGL